MRRATDGANTERPDLQREIALPQAVLDQEAEHFHVQGPHKALREGLQANQRTRGLRWAQHSISKVSSSRELVEREKLTGRCTPSCRVVDERRKVAAPADDELRDK